MCNKWVIEEASIAALSCDLVISHGSSTILGLRRGSIVVVAAHASRNVSRCKEEPIPASHHPRASFFSRGKDSVGTKMCGFRYNARMTRPLRKHRAGFALFATYVFVIQALLTSFSCAVQTGLLDQMPFGGVICRSAATSPASQQAPDVPSNHDSTHCCVLCSAPGLAAVEPDSAPAILRLSVSSSSVVLPATFPSGESARHEPSQPRAPPQLS